MIRREIMKSILDKHTPYYDYMVLILSFVSLGFFVSNLWMGGRLYLLIFTSVFTVVGTGMFLFRQQIHVKVKLLILQVILLVFYVYSVINNGFIGSALFAFAMYIVISVTFYSVRESLALCLLALALFAVMAVLVNTEVISVADLSKSVNAIRTEWYRQLITAAIFVLINYFTIAVIKNFLLNTFEKYDEAAKAIEKKNLSLKKFAFYDRLTGLYNRTYILNILTNGDRLDLESDYLVALLDVVNFRLINANFGIHEGDQLLKSIASVMSEALPEEGILARIGANEFAVLIPKWRPEDLESYGMACLKRINVSNTMVSALPRQPYIIAYNRWKPREDSLEAILDQCNVAVNYAKENQLSGFIEFKSLMYDSLNRRSALLANVSGAMDRDEFQVWFQGKWSHREDRIIGYEALARWQDHKGHTISPAEFIPLINNSRYLEVFSKYILRKSISEFERIQNAHKQRLDLSLNITPWFFLSEGFDTFIMETVQASDLIPQQLILEITEDVFISDYDKLNEIVGSLSKEGFRISLDDFGSGYSSLNHINSIDIDEIKIDRSIIKNAHLSQKSLMIIDLVMKMSNHLGLSVTAEGVETEEQVNLLKEMGVQAIQGYYYSKPSSVKTVLETVKEH